MEEMYIYVWSIFFSIIIVFIVINLRNVTATILGIVRQKSVKYVFSLALPVIVFAVNPFNILTLTNDVSGRISHLIYALTFNSEIEQSNVVTVVIGDEDIDRISPTGFPLTFNRHASLLRTILCAQPSSVYIDIEFQRVREDADIGQSPENAVDRLIDSINAGSRSTDCKNPPNDAENAGKKNPLIPVFLARMRPAGNECKSFPDELQILQNCDSMKLFEKLRQVITPVVVERGDPDQNYLSYSLVTNITNSLPFGEQEDIQRYQGLEINTEPSPAAAMALAYCKHTQGNSHPEELCASLKQLLKTPFLSPLPAENLMVPMWKFYVPNNPAPLWAELAYGPSYKRLPPDNNSCRTYQLINGGESLPLLERVSRASKAILSEMINFGILKSLNLVPALRKSNCLPYPYITGTTLNNCKSQQACFKTIEKIIKGKSVVYGYDIQALKDEVKSPIYGNLPGVFLHSVALDNLLTLSTNYKRVGDNISFGSSLKFEYDINWLKFLATGVLSLILLIKFGCGNRWKWAFRILAIAVIVASITLPMILNFAPIDWLAVVFTLLGQSLIGKLVFGYGPRIRIETGAAPNNRLK